MRRLILFLATTFIGQNIFGQETELFQPDSVYSRNKVKKRIISFDSKSTKSALIYTYDKKGKLIENCLTDNETGKHNQFKILYKYNEFGRRISEVLTTDDSLDMETTKYGYNSLQQLTKKETFNFFDHLIKVENITQNPFTETEIFYDPNTDTIYRKQTSVYENQFAYTNFYGYEFREGKKETWNYKFKNYFDNENRLIRRDDSLWKPLKIIEYYYNKKGLLIKKTERFDRPKSQVMQNQFIKYEYW